MNLFLISNACFDTYPDNKLTNFKNKLPSILEFPNSEKWCVSVESIGFSTNFRNVYLPDNPDAPSFMISNCQMNAPKCENLCRKKDGKVYCTDEECAINIDFKFQENEDNNNCFWAYYRFEDKFYTYFDMENFFLTVKTDPKVAEWIDLGIDPEFRFGAYSKDNFKTNKDVWILISDSMMRTFNISKFPPTDPTFYYKKIGEGKYEILRQLDQEIYSDRYEVILNELPYITHYKNEKYYVFRLESPHKVGKVINLVSSNNNNIRKPQRAFPNLIKVVSDDVDQQIFNSTYSNDLICFCPDFYKEDKYFFHEFENRQYVPLLNSTLTDVNIKLVDHENQYLQLLKGVPTLVKLDFKKMDIEEQFFNVRLTSAKNSNFPDNSKSAFRVKLPNTLLLDRAWQVCLTSISHPNTFKTFMSDINSRKILIREDKEGKNIIHQFILEHKKYSKEKLVSTLDLLFKTSQIGRVMLNEGKLVFLFFKDGMEIMASNYFYNVIGYNGTLDEVKGYTLVKILPNSDYVYYSETTTESGITRKQYRWELPLPINLDFLKPDYIIAYTNIVSPTIIGGIYSKILRIIPIKNSEVDYVVTEFHHKEYLELQNTEINEIEIELRAHDGTPIDFGFNQDVILNLEFKVRNSGNF